MLYFWFQQMLGDIMKVLLIWAESFVHHFFLNSLKIFFFFFQNLTL